MSIHSMTGFARQEGQWQDQHWVWELRSVNGKSLDIRYRLPTGLEKLEPALRKILARHVQRGNIQVALQLEKTATPPLPVLNKPAFKAACELVQKAASDAGLPPPAIDTILTIRGVVDYVEEHMDEASLTKRDEALADSFNKAANLLSEFRQAEGNAISKVLTSQLDRINELTGQIEADPSRSTQNIRQRLTAQLSSLMETGTSLDEHRLHQEAAILATKADLQEEIDRLYSHVQSARKLLDDGGVIGRKLDFLCQEFNRECNTICSKSNAVSVTDYGLEMKVLVDRFREQVQNIQ